MRQNVCAPTTLSARFDGSAVVGLLARWLHDAGMAYGPTAREALARAHPALFGRTYQVALKGYLRWRRRTGADDTLEAFARFVAPRLLREPFGRALSERCL